MKFHSLSNFCLLLSFSILFLSSSLSHANAKIRFKYCGKKNQYAVKVSRIEISPNPIVTGIPATYKLSASSGKPISGGKVAIEAYYFGQITYVETFDLCKKVSCPVAKNGKFLLSRTQTLPTQTTTMGPFEIHLNITDKADKLLTCIKFDIQIN